MTSTVDALTSRKVFLVGATGGVGRRLVPKLVGAGAGVTGVHRRADGASALRDLGAEPLHADLAGDPVGDFAEGLAGHAAVIFCAGAGGGDLVDAIDGDGPGRIARAAELCGVRRFVLVSVFMDAWRGDESPGEGFERYMAAKRRADVAVAATDLDWLIVRPGTLTDDDGTGTVSAGTAVGYDDIPRDDLAGFLAAATFTPGLSRVAVEITSGRTPIADAVSALARR